MLRKQCKRANAESENMKWIAKYVKHRNDRSLSKVVMDYLHTD